DYKDGLVVYIPGFGGDLGTYSKVFCEKVSQSHKLAALTLNYFCIGSRPATGARFEIDKAEKPKIRQVFQELGGSGEASLEKINDLLMNTNNFLRLKGTLEPTKSEYQNFGVLAALDIINAIKDAVKRFDLKIDNVILVGSSYGGYLANLVTKIYPGLVRAVFDNSSWAHPNLSYIIGRELGTAEFSYQILPKIILDLNVKTPWTHQLGLPNTFSTDRKEIRSFTRSQLEQMYVQGGQDTFYVFYHAESDQIADTKEKVEMVNQMVMLGFKNIMMKVMDHSDVDGVLVKNLNHGMGMSMVKFFESCYSMLEEVNPNFQFNSTLGSSQYLLESMRYDFELSTDYAYGRVEVIT
ncbi:MAG: DUF2920 family protein, partial [Methyloprofundus sp.]|nr:DUF2920 family protein [Methyloprofundus sp.]